MINNALKILNLKGQNVFIEFQESLINTLINKYNTDVF